MSMRLSILASQSDNLETQKYFGSLISSPDFQTMWRMNNCDVRYNLGFLHHEKEGGDFCLSAKFPIGLSTKFRWIGGGRRVALVGNFPTLNITEKKNYKGKMNAKVHLFGSMRDEEWSSPQYPCACRVGGQDSCLFLNQFRGPPFANLLDLSVKLNLR